MDKPRAMAVAAFVAASGAAGVFDVVAASHDHTPVCSYRATDLGFVGHMANTLQALFKLGAETVKFKWESGEQVLVFEGYTTGLPPLVPGERSLEAQTLRFSEATEFVKEFLRVMRLLTPSDDGLCSALWVKFGRSITDKRCIVDMTETDMLEDIVASAVGMALGGVTVEVGVEFIGMDLDFKFSANGAMVTIEIFVTINE